MTPTSHITKFHTNLQPISASLFKTKTSSLTIASTSNESPHLNPQQSSSSAGKIKRLVLSPEGRTKLNTFPDRDFYAYPRLVKHVDGGFISTLTNLYRQRLKPEMHILDLMSSWVSHLPKDVNYARVVGHGLNAQELAKNTRLDYFVVKDLNEYHKFEFESSCFDAVLCAVSVQYLQQPEQVGNYVTLDSVGFNDSELEFVENMTDTDRNRFFAEVFRILKPGGMLIVSFSNRLFYEKAISAWRDGTGYSRVQLVVQYFQCVEGFTEPEVVGKFFLVQKILERGWAHPRSKGRAKSPFLLGDTNVGQGEPSITLRRKSKHPRARMPSQAPRLEPQQSGTPQGSNTLQMVVCPTPSPAEPTDG